MQLCTIAVMLKMSFNVGTVFIRDPDNRVPNKIKIVINLEGTLEEAEGCLATHCVQLVGLHCKHFFLYRITSQFGKVRILLFHIVCIPENQRRDPIFVGVGRIWPRRFVECQVVC